MQAAVVKAFQRIYHRAARRTWHDVWYRGTRLHVYPTDLWVYQELVEELKPGLVVQTGTYRGGTALFLADRMQIIGRGHVVTIDAEAEANRPQHPRLTYLTGPPTAADIVDEVRSRLDASAPALFLLGAGTTKDEVLAELESYAPLAPAGSVVVVEHTHLDGPAEALRGVPGHHVRLRGRRARRPPLPHPEPVRVAAPRRRDRARPAPRPRPPPSISTRPPRPCGRWSPWPSTATTRTSCWCCRPSSRSRSSPASRPPCWPRPGWLASSGTACGSSSSSRLAPAPTTRRQRLWPRSCARPACPRSPTRSG